MMFILFLTTMGFDLIHWVIPLSKIESSPTISIIKRGMI